MYNMMKSAMSWSTLSQNSKDLNRNNYESIWFMSMFHMKREEIWLNPMIKAPTPTEKSKKQRDNITKAIKNFDYTTSQILKSLEIYPLQVNVNCYMKS